MPSTRSRSFAMSPAVPVALVLLLSGPAAEAQRGSQERLQRMQQEIRRLRVELAELERLEIGVLGELERVSAESRLREAELEEVGLRLGQTDVALGRRPRSIERLEDENRRTRAYLFFRLREVYKRGPAQALRRLFRGDRMHGYLLGLGYASWLSERDALAIQGLREQTERLRREREVLVRERRRLDALREESLQAQRRLSLSRAARERLLREIHEDQGKRQAALQELERAAREFAGLVDMLEIAERPPSLDVRKFRGLLDAPAQGNVSAGFGTVIHPRFRTEVPHPGMDIEAGQGAPFHSIFDGTVLFASWLRGYGLTVIVDHGHGVLSVYAHASVLLVEAEDQVGRGQELGRVGDTGSLRGPYLYFEIREDGRAVDPAGWLRDAG